MWILEFFSLFIIFLVLLFEIKNERYRIEFNRMLSEYTCRTEDFDILKNTIKENAIKGRNINIYLSKEDKLKIINFAKKNYKFADKYKKILTGELD
jgi:hypothetical protein